MNGIILRFPLHVCYWNLQDRVAFRSDLVADIGCMIIYPSFSDKQEVLLFISYKIRYFASFTTD